MTVSEKIETFYNLIGEKWVPSMSGKTFEVVNPADVRMRLGICQQSTEEDVGQAVLMAKKTWPIWRETPAPERGLYVYKAAQFIEERKDEFIQQLVLEVGKSFADAHAEVIRTLRVMKYLAGEGERLTGETIPSWDQEVTGYTKREPVGVVGIITPWNVPLAIAAWKIATALVCGCTVVFKPSSQTPIVSLKLIQAYQDIGLPQGVINVVTGSGSVVGNAIANHPDIKAISFTGSNNIGNHINQLVAKRGGRFQAEMGGKNPFVVLEDADLDLATDHVIVGGLGESGQRCTATSRVIVLKQIADPFIDMLVHKIKQVKVGAPIDKSNQMGPVIDQQSLENILRYIEIGKQEGAVLLTGGYRLTGPDYDNGYFIAPTVFRSVTPDMTIAQEEIFGPVISVMEAEDFEQAIEWANQVEYGLSSAIYTNDMKRAAEFINRIEAGLTHVNMPSTYSEPQFPFGGIKATGLGGMREVGSTAIDFYTEWKTVYIKPHSTQEGGHRNEH
ncbi:aldehyde dehydrogenase (NAD+) [Caldalkalibacillus uzonensis]|uniref:Aldehyde dehydrogenase (NAD+) n=1 Tax=Caldalkalibacillus uzonensis TaxID=353224 RepID=A0ABU0CP82_9BACI|nr:aldehyde dehydrogenase family protein [Caldalkalibacillus uzonensis]MDQ0338226.1 aldehyde dehydrogenase (NAD+) [Caldalkalibacillus uzonensis]